MSIEQQISYCTNADGVRIAYATYGNEGAPAIVYVSDLPGQEAIWASPWGRAFTEELARHRRLITFDFGGFGASQRDVERHAPDDMVADLTTVADHLRLERFELFAAGMGPSIVSIMYTGGHPGRVSKLALFSPRMISSVADASVAESVQAAFHLYCRSVGTVFFPSGPIEVQRWFSKAIREWASADQFVAFMRGKFDLSSTLSGLALPVLILHRKQSQAVSIAEVRTAASLIPGARLVTLDGDVGVPYWNYEQFIGTLHDFLGVSRDGDLGTVAAGSAVILFTDIVDSTALTERLGDTRFREASRALDAGLRTAIREAGGEAIEGKLLGDGVLATFGSAAQAIDGARRCLALSAASELGLHIGLHAGDVIREEVDGRRDVFGGAVNIASRICGLSAPGEILVSDVVRGMGRSSAGVEFEDRGEHDNEGRRRAGARLCSSRGGLMAEPQIRFATSADGTRIAYAVDAGPLPAILLIWGWPQTIGAISGFDRHLPPDRASVHFDRRGMGASSRDVDDISLDRQVEDVTAIVEALGGQPIDIRANWDGTPIAIAFAAAYPERVERMALIDPYIQGSSATTIEANQALMEMARNNWTMLRRMLGSMIPGRDTGAWSEALRRAVSSEMAARYLEQYRLMDVSRQVELVRCRTLVTYQSGNGAVPRRAVQEAATRLQNCDFLEAASTDVLWESVNRFLDRGDSSAVAAEAPGDAAAKPSAFRTVLFTDIVGHTEMMSRLGDVKGRDVLREHERITRETLKAHGGAEVKTMGDGFMASFGSVTSAMECAIALQRAFASHTESMPEPLHVRVGLNAGEPIEEDGDLFGATVILASRIAAKASAGEILVPDTVRGLLSGKQFLFSDRGEFVPKGFDDAVRLYEVRWRE